MKLTEFEGNRVAILGAGREGQAAWRYLRRELPDLSLTIISESPPDRVFAEQLTARDTIITRPLASASLRDYDILVRSPGISPYRNSIRRAQRARVRVTSASSIWFSNHPEAKTVCITGTKGKSTTSALLAHALRHCGYRVNLAGNIGLPLLSCAVDGIDWWVIELSSYQLADLDACPDVGVILNLTAEHLDWHGGEAAYRQDKLRLADLVGERPLVVNAADDYLKTRFGGTESVTWFNDETGFRVESGALYEGDQPLEFTLPEGLPGVHNLSNIAAALSVIGAIGADTGRAIESFASFASLPHRLRTLGQRRGLEFINDSISSTPVSTVAALRALRSPWVTLIVGGLDRGIDWSPHFEAIRQAAPGLVIGIPDNGARLLEELASAGVHPAEGLHYRDSLAAAVETALEMTPGGGTVLLSPGAPSFPQFRDYADRGRQFARLCGFEWPDEAPSEDG
jgi:UDP-N-acetylmuramoylalanine--D-glutamate ligase